MGSTELSEKQLAEIDAWFEGLRGASVDGATALASHHNDGESIGLLIKERLEMAKQHNAENKDRNFQIYKENLITKAVETLDQLPQKKRHARGVFVAINTFLRRLPWSSRIGSVVALASVLLVAGVLVTQLSVNAPEEEWMILRGGDSVQIIAIRRSEIDQKANRIVGLLTAADSKYIVLRNPKGVQIQAKVNPESRLAQDLISLGVQVPEHGRINVLLQLQLSN
jgi:hypothetical protein